MASSPSHASSMPAFADVLNMINTIPDECSKRRVTHWAKEKYKIEGELEEKLERLEKTVAHRDFKVKNLEQNVKTLQNSEDAFTTAKKNFSASEKKVKILENKIEELERSLQEKNDAIKGILSESDDLAKQLEDSEKKNGFYEKEITKLLDEKEQMLEAAKEDDSSDDSDSGDSDSESSEESEDSESSDDDDDQTRFVAAATLLRRMEFTIEKLEASDEKVMELTKELDSVKKEKNKLEEALNAANKHITKFESLATQFEQKFEKSEKGRKEIHIQWSGKWDEERLLKEKAQQKIVEQDKTIELMQKIMHAESTKFRSLIDEAAKAQCKITDELMQTADQKLTLEAKWKRLSEDYIAKSVYAANLQAAHAEKEGELTAQLEVIKKLQEAERAQCNQRLASQDKLVAQMEKTFELQEEIKKLNEKVENLGVESIETDESDDDEEEVEVGEEVKEEEEQKEEEKEQENVEIDEEEYSSDSSFEPIDEADLYN